jgi:hypothetical protein
MSMEAADGKAALVGVEAGMGAGMGIRVAYAAGQWREGG